MLRNFFRSSSWAYAHSTPTALMTATVIVLLLVRLLITRSSTTPTTLLRWVNALTVVSVVLFGLLVYARFVTFG